MRKIDKAVQLAIAIANDNTHGYSQEKRNGPDYDCSSLVNHVIRESGIPVTATYTGNMLSDYLNKGFLDVSNVNLATGEGLKPGDVLLTHYSNNNGHTALYIGNGKIVHATGNEFGGIKGGQTGDQTGNEICVAPYFNFPWQHVLRYCEDDDDGTMYYTVKAYDTLWSIARQFNTTIDELVELNNIQDRDKIYRGQVLRIKGDAPIIPVDSTIKITIDGVSIKTCKQEGNTIVIVVGD